MQLLLFRLESIELNSLLVINEEINDQNGNQNIPPKSG